MASHLLYPLSSGYALFERLESEEIGQELEEVQASVLDLAKFGKIIKLKSFRPFQNAADALENINSVSEGMCTKGLKDFLEMNVPQKKSSKFTLGVDEKNLAGSIRQELGITCVSNELVMEIMRGIRFHADKFLSQLKSGDLEKSQLGLGHSYSRAKVKFNVNRSDNMIIQSISLLDQLDKDVNTFSMRVREWYGWHFPELVKIVNDNANYARLVKIIKNKSELTDSRLDEIEQVVKDPTTAQHVIDAAKSSMGTDISAVDMENIESFADRVIALADYRKKLFVYLSNKMNCVAPNLAALIGDVVGARLISHAGSLTNLSKYPASTVQILGAEKALFRALKTKGNTPKYGLIYHSSFIGRAGQKNKGRISRYLANKCTIASRIDCFTDFPTTKFGEALRDQVEERLTFFESGKSPRKNLDVMQKVLDNLKIEGIPEKEDEKKEKSEKSDKKKKRKKDKSSSSEEKPLEAAPTNEEPSKEEEPPKDKKSKKDKSKKDKSSKEKSSKEKPSKKKARLE